MRFSSFLLVMLLGATSLLGAEAPKPLRALMITGGCCHDYTSPKKIISEGISARTPVEWTIVHDVEMVDGKDAAANREHLSSAYAKDNWAEGFDVVVHNECYGAMKDPEVLARIAKGHKQTGVPAVFLHCAMHSYRMAKDEDANLWRELIGAKSMYHEAGAVLKVKAVEGAHPVIKGFPAEFTTPEKDELYILEKVYDTATVLAHSYSEKLKVENPVIWVNQVGSWRSFSTSLGHQNSVMQTPEYLDLVTRGLLWVCGRGEASAQ
jgi:type 1 glutamine amidotransferase